MHPCAYGARGRLQNGATPFVLELGFAYLALSRLYQA